MKSQNVLAIKMFLLTLCAALFTCAQCTHIFGLEKDFSKLNDNKELVKHVEEIINKLKTFKVAVHPRIRMFYQLLKRGMADYAQKTSDSLYNPSVYNKAVDNVN